MPIVTRNQLVFSGVDIPYVDFEVKGLLVFFNFTRSLTYCIPDGTKKALWPGGPSVARDDEVDLTVRDWSFWLLADDAVEMSCTFSGAFGPRFSFYNMEKGINIAFPVTTQEARAIKRAVNDMVKTAESDGEAFQRDHSLKVLKPSYSVMSYHVKAYRWSVKTPRTSIRDFTPKWNPIVPGY